MNHTLQAWQAIYKTNIYLLMQKFKTHLVTLAPSYSFREKSAIKLPLKSITHW